MRFSFIPNGLVWQQFVSRLFVADRDRPRSPVKGFKTVSAERLRDYGLDGIEATSRGTIFQMFFPLWEPGEPRHKRVNDKLDETCRKLRTNAPEIEAIIGAPVKRLILVIPEDPDVKIREHEKKLEKKVSFKIDIWGEAEVSAMLSRHPDAVRDFLPFQVESVSIEKILKEAKKHHNQGNFPKAREYYEKAEFYSLLHEDPKSRCQAEEGLAALAYEIGEMPLSKDYAIDAVRMARGKDSKFLPKALITLAQIEGSMGKHKEAEKLLREALLHARKQKQTELVPEIEAFQGRLALSQGNIKRAKSLFDRCFGPLQKEGGVLFVIILEFKAQLAKKEGDIGGAIHWLERAIEVAEKDTYPLIVGKLAMQLAELLFSQKRFEETRRALEKAESCFRKSGQEKDQLLAKLHLAKTLLFDGKHSESAAILPAIVNRARETRVHFISGEANLLLADIAAQSGEWQRALGCAEAGYKDFAWEHSLYGQIRALLVMGRIAERAAEVSGATDMQVKAEEFRSRAMKHLEEASPAGIPSELAMDVRAELARSKEINGKFEESITILETMQPDSLRDQEKRQFAQDFIDSGVKRCFEKIRVRDLLKKVKDHGQPLEWAQTQHAKTIQEAHLETHSTLLEWMDIWPEARCELLDFWGRGNFIRLLLSHQATEKAQLENAFTLCVEVTTVEQADLACRILYPLVDCLVLIWKGAMEEGLTIVPQHEEYSGPGGWGYMTCAGDIVQPEKEGTGTWHPAIGWARLLPREIVDFVFIEARPMVERGHLILIPASLVGCEFRGHGYFEKLLIQELLNANPVMVEVSEGQPYLSGFPMVVPYFPQAPLADLAKMVDDYEDILLETRIACLEWGDEVRKEGDQLSDHKKQIVSVRIKDAFARIRNTLQVVAGKMPSHLPFDLMDERINPSAIVAPTPTVASSAGGLASSGLYAALQKDALPWYPFWQLQSKIGGHWRIAGPKLPPPQPLPPQRQAPAEMFRVTPQKTSTHWIQPPEGGWAIPSARRI